MTSNTKDEKVDETLNLLSKSSLETSNQDQKQIDTEKAEKAKDEGNKFFKGSLPNLYFLCYQLFLKIFFVMDKILIFSQKEIIILCFLTNFKSKLTKFLVNLNKFFK